MSPDTVSAAFTQMNEKKSWKSRVFGDTVHFSATNGMVTLIYHATDGRFGVKFQRFQGAWGDYISAIARGLFYVLNTLKSAGLPFDAPSSLEGCVIEATTGSDNTVYVRWAGAEGLLAAFRKAYPGPSMADILHDTTGEPNALPPLL